jgi:hypothetical protein
MTVTNSRTLFSAPEKHATLGRGSRYPWEEKKKTRNKSNRHGRDTKTRTRYKY